MNFPFWNICEECALSNGGTLEVVGAITVTGGTCPYCGQEEKMLIPVRDFLWKWFGDTKAAHAARWD